MYSVGKILILPKIKNKINQRKISPPHTRALTHTQIKTKTECALHSTNKALNRDASWKMLLLYSVGIITVILIFINCAPFSEAANDWFPVHKRKPSPWFILLSRQAGADYVLAM